MVFTGLHSCSCSHPEPSASRYILHLVQWWYNLGMLQRQNVRKFHLERLFRCIDRAISFSFFSFNGKVQQHFSFMTASTVSLTLLSVSLSSDLTCFRRQLCHINQSRPKVLQPIRSYFNVNNIWLTTVTCDPSDRLRGVIPANYDIDSLDNNKKINRNTCKWFLLLEFMLSSFFWQVLSFSALTIVKHIDGRTQSTVYDRTTGITVYSHYIYSIRIWLVVLTN